MRSVIYLSGEIDGLIRGQGRLQKHNVTSLRYCRVNHTLKFRVLKPVRIRKLKIMAFYIFLRISFGQIIEPAINDAGNRL